jgi:hypothetical protein
MQSGRNMKMTTIHAVPKSRIREGSLHVPQHAPMAWHIHPSNTTLILASVPCCMLEGQRSIPGRGKRFFSNSQSPDGL